MIGSFGSNEIGTYNHSTGIQMGDQTGREGRVREWYDFGQEFCLWHPEQKVNDLVAQIYRTLCEMNVGGYCQDHRATLWRELERVGYDPSKMTVACEADCSSSVAAAVKAAGYLLGMQKLKNISPDAYTGNLKPVLVGAGYNCTTESKYLRSESALFPGCILLKPYSHVVIELSGTGYVPTKRGLTTAECLKKLGEIPCIELGERGDRVKAIQHMLNVALDLDDFGQSIRVDGDFGSETLRTVKRFQESVGIEVDGSVGPETLGNLSWYIFEKA